MSRAALVLVLVLVGCGGGTEDYECPEVTDANVHLMTGDLPPGHPCTQDFRENAPNVVGESKPIGS